jgi:hypothetical protein
MVPIFSGLFKFFYLQSGSYIWEFECFLGAIIGKIAILSGCIPLFKNIVDHCQGEGISTRLSL